MSHDHLIRTVNLCKIYPMGLDHFTALDDVNLDFKQADKSKTLNQWKFNLEKNGSAWIITSISD